MASKSFYFVGHWVRAGEGERVLSCLLLLRYLCSHPLGLDSLAHIGVTLHQFLEQDTKNLVFLLFEFFFFFERVQFFPPFFPPLPLYVH